MLTHPTIDQLRALKAPGSRRLASLGVGRVSLITTWSGGPELRFPQCTTTTARQNDGMGITQKQPRKGSSASVRPQCSPRGTRPISSV